MPIFLIAAASALLLAYLITELTTRLWPQDNFALLVVCIIALLINGLFNAILAKRSQPQQNKKGGGQNNRDNRNSRASNKQPKRQPKKPSRSADNGPSKPSGKEEQGRVKWFNRAKGYGFIIRENEEEVFVHQRSIVGEGDDPRQRPVLRDGQEVSFVVTSNEKGVQAEYVRALD